MVETPDRGPGDVQVLTMGRVGVDLYPEQLRVPLAEVRTFRKMLGGTATNVAVAAARYGRSEWSDHEGRRRSVRPLRAAGAAGVRRRRLPGRNPSDAANAHRLLRDLPARRLPAPLLSGADRPRHDDRASTSSTSRRSRRVPLFWTTGTGLSEEPSRTATLAALDARDRRSITVHDLDYRPMFWSSETEPGRLGRMAVERATVVVGGRTEAIPLVGDRSASDTARALLELGVELAIVKLGPDGVLGATQDEEIVLPPDPGRGRQRARCRRCLRRRALPRAPRGLATRADAAVRERRRCTRRISPRLRRRHADGGGGRGAARPR